MATETATHLPSGKSCAPIDDPKRIVNHYFYTNPIDITEFIDFFVNGIKLPQYIVIKT